MDHPETMLRLVRDRHEAFAKEAKQDRLARAASAAQHQDKRERFSVRDLRWILFRPSEA
jgi:hypothetical protein